MQGKLYDVDGKEIEVKPGHAVCTGKDSFCQLPMSQYSAQFVYRVPAGKYITELGTSTGFRCLKSDGTYFELKAGESIILNEDDG